MEDLQKASLWKRISAFLFDMILLGIAAVLFAWALSAVCGYDGWQKTLDDAYTRYGEAYGVDFRVDLAGFDALEEAQKRRLEEAYQALAADPDAVRAYDMVMQLTVTITSLGILLAFAALEFAVPLFLGDGRTLGKRIFSLGVMRREHIRIRGPSLFVRVFLGKYAIETMIPVLVGMMIYWGSIGVVGPVVLLLIAVTEAAVMIGTPGNAMIHDLLADTVVIDHPSQRIFDTREDRIAWIEKKHAEWAAEQTDG